MKFNSIDSAIEDIKNGRCIIVVDNESTDDSLDIVRLSSLLIDEQFLLYHNCNF